MFPFLRWSFQPQCRAARDTLFTVLHMQQCFDFPFQSRSRLPTSNCQLPVPNSHHPTTTGYGPYSTTSSKQQPISLRPPAPAPATAPALQHTSRVCSRHDDPFTRPPGVTLPSRQRTNLESSELVSSRLSQPRAKLRAVPQRCPCCCRCRTRAHTRNSVSFQVQCHRAILFKPTAAANSKLLPKESIRSTCTSKPPRGTD